jgi:hypothetical protein
MPTPEDDSEIPYSERELIQRAIRSLDRRGGSLPRYVRVKQLFVTDSEASRAICYKYGFDPDKIPSDPAP